MAEKYLWTRKLKSHFFLFIIRLLLLVCKGWWRDRLTCICVWFQFNAIRWMTLNPSNNFCSVSQCENTEMHIESLNYRRKSFTFFSLRSVIVISVSTHSQKQFMVYMFFWCRRIILPQISQIVESARTAHNMFELSLPFLCHLETINHFAWSFWRRINDNDGHLCNLWLWITHRFFRHRFFFSDSFENWTLKKNNETKQQIAGIMNARGVCVYPFVCTLVCLLPFDQ